MKLLLLGASPASLSLTNALHHAGHRVDGWILSDDVDSRLYELFPSARRFSSVDEFERAAGEALIIVSSGGEPQPKENILRNLARDGVPMVLVQPACSAIFAIELDMIQRDTEAPMIPVHAAALHPALDRLHRWLGESDLPIGKVEQVVFERQAADRSDVAVRAHLAQDAILLRRLIGQFQKVGAMQAGQEKSLSNLSAHMTGKHDAIARWSIGPLRDDPSATLSLIGERGSVTLIMPDRGPWQLQSSDSGMDTNLPEFNAERAMVDQVESGIAGHYGKLTWEDAFRSLDFADTACESVRRGKTLTINNERLTEEDTFKSMMAAGGCLIILVLPLLLLLVSLVDGMKIPYEKQVLVEVVESQRNVQLPADLNALKNVQLAANDVTLVPLTTEELFASYDIKASGTPEGYSVSRNDITLAPIPDRTYRLRFTYEGAFSIWSGWPLLLLLPILFFLALQLFRLAFPRNEQATRPAA